VDTGAHYRAVTRALLDAGARAEDVASVLSALAHLRLGSEISGISSVVTLDGHRPVDASLRSEDVNAAVSKFAALPAVRNFLLAYQRSQVALGQAAGFAGVIMEGRDIGSVVLPQAEVRVFLQADPVARAQRRAAEGQTDAVAQRDLLDSTRATAPLVCPEGATRIDNTHLPLVEVVAQVKALIQSVARPA
jgi:cytidylate kinase